MCRNVTQAALRYARQTALYDTRSITCESKLYFQSTTKDGPCKRSLMLHYETPTLLRHGKVRIYHFPSQRQVTTRCPRDNVWVTRTRTLSGAGLIHNATRCSITSGEIRTLPELHGVAHANLYAPAVYVPDSSPILSSHELVSKRHSHRRSRTGSAEGPSCNRTEIAQRRHPSTHPEDYIPKGNPAALASDAAVSCTITVLLVLYIFLQSKFQWATSCCLRTNKSPEDATPRSPTHPVPASERPTTTAYSEPHCDSVTFAAYALPCKN